jgi:hypothetical protein
MLRKAAASAMGLLCFMVAYGCGGGGTGSAGQTQGGPNAGDGAMGQASPFIGYIKFLSSSTCTQNGYYLTLHFGEDAQGNLGGTIEGRYVSPQNPPPSGDDKYKGPLAANITGKRTGDDITITLSGNINGTYTGHITHGSGFAKITGTFTGQPGCSDSNGNLHGGEVFLVGDEMP